MIRWPAELCRELLSALEASEGRRRRRGRNTTPDAIGMAIKRELLERAITDDPAPDAFEAWLLEQCQVGAATHSAGAVRALATEILAEYHLTAALPAFDAWLAAGAPSEDRSRHGQEEPGQRDGRSHPTRLHRAVQAGE
jgi:hypothetical protein